MSWKNLLPLSSGHMRTQGAPKHLTIYQATQHHTAKHTNLHSYYGKKTQNIEKMFHTELLDNYMEYPHIKSKIP
jgi:hypothetical protein